MFPSMSVSSTPLARQVATIRGAILTQEKCAWIPAGVHALIIACLARIFGRLEEMIRLWQSGQLPPPPASRPHAARRASLTPRIRHWPTARPRHARSLPIPDSASAIAVPAVSFPMATPRAGRKSTATRPAHHRPDAPIPQKSQATQTPWHVYFITI